MTGRDRRNNEGKRKEKEEENGWEFKKRWNKKTDNKIK